MASRLAIKVSTVVGFSTSFKLSTFQIRPHELGSKEANPLNRKAKRLVETLYQHPRIVDVIVNEFSIVILFDDKPDITFSIQKLRILLKTVYGLPVKPEVELRPGPA